MSFSKIDKLFNVLWLCNIRLPMVSEALGESPSAFGGWLDETSRSLIKLGHQLTVLYPSSRKENGSIGKFHYRSFSISETETVFSDVLSMNRPDVIHIWGTEIEHSYKMIAKLETLNLLNRTVISIQGLVSTVYEHYCVKLPHKVIHGKTLRDLVRRTNVYNDMKDFRSRGEKEKKTIQKAQHIIGRTRFDEAYVKNINPDALYYNCGEILRSSFYHGVWNIQKCEPYSIFVSQANYPIKGFHIFLEAMSDVVKKYPSSRVYVAGSDPTFSRGSVKEKMKITYYGKYLRSLIHKYGLIDSVVFTGTLDEQKMKERYLSSHVFVSASTIENSPNSLGEAMILGLPCVASYVGGVPSMIDDQKDGYLYQVDAPYMLSHYITRIFSNDKDAIMIGKNARSRALETYNIKQNIEKLQQIYSFVREEI